jgi:hypothetical protein
MMVVSLDVANTAVRLAPSDPEAHRARGAVLRYLGQLPEAAQEYETAVSLRHTDDIIWLEVGIVRDESEDSNGAVAAMTEAIARAPFYAHPRWQRGNVLLRQGKYDEAFADLRYAANSNLELQPNLIDLTWGISRGDAKLTEQILQIDDDRMRIKYARYLARKGKGAETLEQLELAHAVPAKIRKEIVTNLVAQKSFKEAYEIWSDKAAGTAVFDGSFESPLILDESTFGWRVAQVENQSLSIDTGQKQSGTKSLRVQFGGNTSPSTPVVSQLVVVEPNKRYRLNFAMRTQELVSGGLPVVTVNDAMSELLLGKSSPFKSGTSDWSIASFEFATPANSNAVVVALKRENCQDSPCPVFGVVWLDSFSLEQVTR